MSNINTWAGRHGHGLDDEPHEVVRDGKVVGFSNRCPKCWPEAKRVFFAGPPRRGRTLAKVYAEIHNDAHQY